jgi:hypothetical protein
MSGEVSKWILVSTRDSQYHIFRNFIHQSERGEESSVPPLLVLIFLRPWELPMVILRGEIENASNQTLSREGQPLP